MTTVYKVSFFSRIGSVIGTLFAAIPLALFWAFIVFLLEEIVPLPDIVYLVFAGVLSTALCFFLQNYGIKHVDTSTAGIILSLESLFGVLAASTIGGEVLGISAIIGFIIMFSGIILAERG